MTSRDRRLIMGGYGLLLLAWILVAVFAYTNSQRINDNNDRINKNAVRATAIQCLLAFAPEQPLAAEPDGTKGPPTEIDLAKTYISKNTVQVSLFGPECQQAVDKVKAELKTKENP